MKKVLLVLLAVVAVSLTGCRKETTCQVQNLSGFSLYDVTIWEFNISNNVINARSIGTLHDGYISDEENIFPATSYVKISFRYTPSSDWVYTVYRSYVFDGQNTVVKLTGSTQISEFLQE